MTKCDGCQEELDGLLAHVEHECPTPLKHRHKPDLINDVYVTLGVMKAIDNILLEDHEKSRNQLGHRKS